MLGKDGDIQLVGSASNGEDGLDLVVRTKPDVAVVDYSLPEMSGIEVCERIVATMPTTAVVVLTTYLNDEVILKSVEAGAQAYVYKDVEALELKKAIRAVTKGETVLDPKVAGRVVNWANRRKALNAQSLSLQETEVLRCVTRGLTNTAISEHLKVSENTVKTYLRRIMEKLDCHSRSEAAAIAARKGLL